MKSGILIIILLCSSAALAKVETICGHLDFSYPISIGEGNKFKNYKNHEIRNQKDKFYYQILDGEELSEKEEFDELCITGEVIRMDKGRHLMQKMSGRPNKIKMQSYSDND